MGVNVTYWQACEHGNVWEVDPADPHGGLCVQADCSEPGDGGDERYTVDVVIGLRRQYGGKRGG